MYYVTHYSKRFNLPRRRRPGHRLYHFEQGDDALDFLMAEHLKAHRDDTFTLRSSFPDAPDLRVYFSRGEWRMVQTRQGPEERFTIRSSA